MMDELKLQEIETILWSLRPTLQPRFVSRAYLDLHKAAGLLNEALREAWGRIEAMKEKT